MKHILDLPWGPAADELKEKYSLRIVCGGAAMYSGVLLPKDLRKYRVEDFSYNKWIEDEENAHVNGAEAISSSQYSVIEEVSKYIYEEFNKDQKFSVVLGENSGDKKSSIIKGLMNIVEEVEEYRGEKEKANLLIITSKSEVSQWRSAAKNNKHAVMGCRILIITPTQLTKLLTSPPTARISKKKSTKERIISTSGRSTINWDFVVVDTPDLFDVKNRRTISIAARLLEISKKYSKHKNPYTVFSLPKINSNPLSYSLISQKAEPSLDGSFDAWGRYLLTNGFSVREDKRRGWVWLPTTMKNNPDLSSLEQREQTLLRRKFQKTFVNISSTTSFDYLPVSMNGSKCDLYENKWRWLKRWLNTHPKGNPDTMKNISEFLSFTDGLKQDQIVSMIADNPNRRYIIKISSTILEERIMEKLLEKKIPVVKLSNPADDSWKLFNSQSNVVFIYEKLSKTSFEKIISAGNSSYSTTNIVVSPVLSKEFQNEALAFGDSNSLTRVVYLEKTFEENFVKKCLQDSSMNKMVVENVVRIAAAKTTPPNRLS